MPIKSFGVANRMGLTRPCQKMFAMRINLQHSLVCNSYAPIFILLVEPCGLFLGPFADHIGNAGPVDLEAGQINQDKAK